MARLVSRLLPTGIVIGGLYLFGAGVIALSPELQLIAALVVGIWLLTR